jgi:hypothetical protein
LAPPFVITDVKLTGVPGQKLFADAVIVTDGVINGLTVTGIAFDDVAAGTVHAILPVSIHFTISLFFRVVVINLSLFEPVLIPFTCH